MTDLVDLKRTKADQKAQEAEWSEISRDDYPYGLSIHINEETMAKLGLTDADFDAGRDVTVIAEGYISEDRVNMNDGKKKRSMSIQFRKMCVEQGEGGADVTSAMYGDSK